MEASGGGDGPDVELVTLSVTPGRPSGTRFGSLVHVVLATTSLDETIDPEPFATLHGRTLGATPDEVTAATHAVRAALAHPLLRRAHAAWLRGECRREVPVSASVDDQTVVDGVVDLAFCEDARWTVVDFKTDQELTDALDVYRRQVALYAEMIGRATGQATHPILIRV